MKVFVDGFRVFMDDGNKVVSFVTGANVNQPVPVDAVPDHAVRVRLDKPRVSPAEKWADRMVALISEEYRHRLRPGAASVIRVSRDLPEMVQAIRAVCVAEYDPAPPKRIAKNLDELRRIADGGQVAFIDEVGDLCVWRDGEGPSYWCQGTANTGRDIRAGLPFPVEVIRVVKSESQGG